jgi:hypothetical protein
MQRERTSVTVTFDAGTSGSKVIASYQSGEYPFERVEKYFLIEPSVRQLTEATYNNLLEYVYDDTVVGSSLISYVEPQSERRTYWEVGETATRPGMLAVGERKFEKLLAKVLSFLGYLVKGEILSTELVELKIGVLLPFDEIDDRWLLAKWLEQILGKVEEEISQGFEFNGTKITNISLGEIDCKPEGYGIYKTYPSDRCAVLIIGHSDSSWLYFNNKKLNLKLSRTLPETGMHDFLQTLNFPISYELRAAEILAQAGMNLKPSILAELTQTKKSSEIERLQQVIREAKVQYWIERQAQFNSLEALGVTRVLVSGGAANYFALELNQLFKERFGIQLRWCKSLMLEFFERFKLKQKSDLLHRFADCYGYYRTLPGVEPYQKKSVEVAGGASNA